ncbi:MAG: OmpH family outer membrane protein [candidate division Zixibacteria bacterium]|nr:OmpH family outer membrane protein [candidate division Zixibacteria bacterium]
MRSEIRNWMRQKNLNPFVIRHPSLVIFYLSLVFSFLLLFPNSTSSQEGRIGYIDSMRLRTEFEEFAEAQSKFDQDVQAWQDEAAQMKKTIDSLEADLEKISLILSEAKKKEKEDSLEAEKLNYQKFTNDIFGPGGKAEKRNAELTKPILDKINLVLEKIATEENFIMIFDSVNGNIAYAKKSLDLTDLVLEELRKLE